MNPETITQITNYSLIGIFVLICIGLLIAMIRGWKKGIWRTCFRMIMMATLFVLTFCLMRVVCDALAVMPLNWLPFKSIVLTNDNGEVYYVALTTFKDTVREVAKGYYYINHIPYSPDRIIAIANAFADTTVKTTYVLFSFFLIFIFGNLLCLILWHLIFKKIVPLIAQKLVRVKWLAMIQNGITYILVMVLFISPLSTMVNLLNQSYQQNKEQVNKNNQIVQTATCFLDTYNESIFGNLFNWSADENGITFDAKLMGWLSQTSTEYGDLNLVNELDNLLDLSMYLTNALGDGMELTFEYVDLITDETVDAIFDALGNSELFTMVLPAALNIGTNLDLVKNTVDLSYINFEDFTYTGEEGENVAIRNMLKNFIDAGIVDGFIDEEGNFTTNVDTKSMIRDLVGNRDKFDKIISAFDQIDKSELLSAIIPSFMLLLNESNEKLDQYLPDTWEELISIKWGRELTIVLDTLQRIATVGENNEVLEAILDMMPGGDAEPSKAKLYANSDDEDSKNNLTDAIINHLDEIKEILCGKVDDSHEDDGTTKIIDNEDRFNLFDCELMKWMITPLMDLVRDLVGSAVSNRDKLNRDMDRSKQQLAVPDKWRANFRGEFTAIFDVFEKLAKYQKIMDVISNPMDVFSDLGNLDRDHPGLRVALSEGLERMDNSCILRSVLGQVFKDTLTDKSVLGGVGLDTNAIEDGFDYCDRDDVNTMGKELAFLIYNISSISQLTKISDSESPIDAISEKPENKMHIANLLDVLYLSKILNGGVDEGGNPKKDNYFNALHFLFDKVHSAEESLVFDIDSYRDADVQWLNSRTGEEGKANYSLDGAVLTKGVNDIDPKTNLKYRGENANIAIALYTMSEQNVTDVFGDMISIKSLSSESSRNAIHKSLSSAGDSIILSGALGNFLDTKLEGKGLTDEEAKFANVTDWHSEADKLDNILKFVGEFNGDLQDLDLSGCTDIVGLNNLLHSLADSNIFFAEDGKYIFSHWMYNKVTSTIAKGTDLFADPESWNVELWGEKPDLLEDHYIAKTDFYSLDKKSDWYGDDFDTGFDITKFGSKENYFENPDFFFEYFARPKTASDIPATDGYRCDELGRICEVIYFVSCQNLDLSKIKDTETSTFKGIFNAICDTDSMRICVYNSFNQVADTVKTDLINLDEARNEYLIDCNKTTKGISKPEVGRKERHFECDVVNELFDVYKTIGTGSGLSDIFSITDDTFKAVDKSFTLMADSKVYHQLGPTPASLETDSDTLTTFQSLMVHLYDNDVFKDGLLFSDHSSKDNYFKAKGYYEDVESKIKHTVLNFFSWKDLSNIELQKQEISSALLAAKKLQKLKVVSPAAISDDNSIDFSKLSFDSPTLEVIEDFLNCYDQDTRTFFDVVPNLFRKLFNSDSQFKTIGENILKDASVEFMYKNKYETYTDNVTEERFNNRVTSTEIGNLMDVLRAVDFLKPKDDSEELEIVFSDMSILSEDQINGMKNVFKAASKSYMLHVYNDNRNETDKYTVFENLINKVLNETQLSSVSPSCKERVKTVSKLDGQVLDVPSLTDTTLQEYLTDMSMNKIMWNSEASSGENQINFIFEFVHTCKNLNITTVTDSSIRTPGKYSTFISSLKNIYLCKGAESSFPPLS